VENKRILGGNPNAIEEGEKKEGDDREWKKRVDGG
jgi:hypothetical protein